MARSSVGVDVGTSAVGIAEVRHNGDGPELIRFGRALLPAGAVEHGEIQDPAVVGSTIAELARQLGVSGRAAHVGLANRRVVVRVVDFPVMDREDLEGAIRFQAAEHIPIPLDQAVMDFEVLEQMDGPDAQPMQRVLIVAAERATIRPLLEALDAANLAASTVELNAYPLVRCFGSNGSADAGAIVDVGAGVTNVVVQHAGRIRFTRILPSLGGDEFTAAVANGLEITVADAEELKRKAGKHLRSALHHDPDDEHRSREQVAADLMAPILDRLVTEVRGSIDFYTLQPGAPRVERVLLTGGGSLLGGLRERLAASMGVAVESGHAFAHVPAVDVDMSKKQLSVAEPFLGVAVGLALAENGG